MPPSLKLVREGGPGRARDLWPLLAAGTLALAAIAATLAGAQRARAARPAREIAAEALQAALARGSADEQVRLAATELRRRLGRQPLDSRTRVAYASLLHGLGRSVADTAAAAFHARRAAELAPVTVPVVRAATLVLARSLRWREAAGYVREMFRYDTESAARLLLTLEPYLPADVLERALADDARAWLAWIDRLRIDQREADASRWLHGALERWPHAGALLDRAATAAARSGDPERLVALFRTQRKVAESPANARVFAFRGHARALEHDLAAARNDLELALELGGNDARLQIVAGDAYEAMGDDGRAAELWARAQFSVAPGAEAVRLRALVRLARLEERQGRAGDALRLWRSIRQADPSHVEAERRVRALTGG